MPLSEPVRIYWAVGIAASIVLHASGVAGAVLLAERYTGRTVETQISFSNEGSAAAVPVATATEAAVVSQAATVAEPEKPAPAAAETVRQTSEPVEPVQPEIARATEQDSIAPSGTENATATTAETIDPLGSDDVAEQEKAATLLAEDAEATEPTAPEALSSLPPDTAETQSAAEAVDAASADIAQPVSTSEVPPSDKQETAVPFSDGASVAAANGAETVASSNSAVTGTGSGGSVETLSATTSAERLSGDRPETTALGGDSTQVETLTPVTTSGSGQAAPFSGGQETVAPIEQPFETALLVPARPGSVLGTAVDQPSDRYRRIVDFVRRYAGGDCFIALPAMSPGGVVTFQTFGRDKQREDAFRTALAGFDGLEAEVSGGNVADTQCLALSFAREVRRYPGFSLIIDLDEADMKSGTRLSGSVLNVQGRELHLLLVDNDGLVQSIDRFLEPGDTADRPFSAPLVLTGGPVVTKQILIAVATNDRLDALSEPVQEPAGSYFTRLSDEIEKTGADVDLAVEGFSVR